MSAMNLQLGPAPKVCTKTSVLKEPLAVPRHRPASGRPSHCPHFHLAPAETLQGTEVLQ